MAGVSKDKARVLVWFVNNYNPVQFYDWFDLADYIKQENLKSRDVAIRRWLYVHVQD